jgi:hypothetical protein
MKDLWGELFTVFEFDEFVAAMNLATDSGGALVLDINGPSMDPNLRVSYLTKPVDPPQPFKIGSSWFRTKQREWFNDLWRERYPNGEDTESEEEAPTRGRKKPVRKGGKKAFERQVLLVDEDDNQYDE